MILEDGPCEKLLQETGTHAAMQLPLLAPNNSLQPLFRCTSPWQAWLKVFLCMALNLVSWFYFLYFHSSTEISVTDMWTSYAAWKR